MEDDLIASSTAVTTLIRKTQKGNLSWVSVYCAPSSEVWSTPDGDSTVFLTTGSIIESGDSKPPDNIRAVFAGMDEDEQPMVVIENNATHRQEKIEYFPAVKDLIFAVKKST